VNIKNISIIKILNVLINLFSLRRIFISASNYKYRQKSLKYLHDFSSSSTTEKYTNKILVDGSWDNANYWLRYAVFRKSLNLSECHEIGLLGEFRRSQSRSAFKYFKFKDQIDFESFVSTNKYLDVSAKLVSELKSSHDMFNWKLPYDTPVEVLYDGFLKKYKVAQIDINHPKLIHYVAYALAVIEAAERILREESFHTIILSHAVGITYSSLALAAIRNNTKVYILYGLYGSVRFIELKEISDLFHYPDGPVNLEFNEVKLPIEDEIRSVGRKYLKSRFSGKADDVGAIYAYQKRKVSVTREQLIKEFGWDADKPIIGIYASVIYDFPHYAGRMPFDNFPDWINQTLEIASKNKNVNWLLKEHPCDEWYGAQNTKIIGEKYTCDSSNIKIANNDWNGYDLLISLDGIVTCHGTVGIEASYLKIPVLVSHRGWYGDIGFTLTPNDTYQYKLFLEKEWWLELDLNKNSKAAELFAGWYFGIVDLGDEYIYQDDAFQDAIYWNMIDFIEINLSAINKEIKYIQDWVESDSPFYHVFKVNNSDKMMIASSNSINYDPRQVALRGKQINKING